MPSFLSLCSPMLKTYGTRNAANPYSDAEIGSRLPASTHILTSKMGVEFGAMNMIRQSAVLTPGVCLTLLNCFTIPAVAQNTRPSGISRGVWPCLRGNTRNTGQSLWRAPGSSIAWIHATVPEKIQYKGILTSPALNDKGIIYVANRRLEALNAATGERKWEFSDCPLFNGSPILGEESSLYIGGADAFLYALQRVKEACAGGSRQRSISSQRPLWTPRGEFTSAAGTEPCMR